MLSLLLLGEYKFDVLKLFYPHTTSEPSFILGTNVADNGSEKCLPQGQMLGAVIASSPLEKATGHSPTEPPAGHY